jgi:Rrf2 family protein
VAANSRLTIAVHVLTWMALAAREGKNVVTSERVAVSVNTNPVVIRRVLGELRAAGLVQVRRGAGAGWSLARAAEELSLLDVREAVGETVSYGMHAALPNQECPVGRGIQPALQQVYDDLDDAVMKRLRAVSIADVLRSTLIPNDSTRGARNEGDPVR